MVYAASLSLLAKKALGPKCHQSSIANIMNTLPIDPETSGMDVVLIGPNDLAGAARKALPEAVDRRHPGVCVIYICSTDKERALFPNAPNVKQVRKLKVDNIVDAVNEFYSKESQMRDKANPVLSKKIDPGDNPVPRAPIAPPPEKPKRKLQKPVKEPEFEPEPEYEYERQPAPEPPPPPVQEPVQPPPEFTRPVAPPPPPPPEPSRPPIHRLEDEIDNIKSVNDWDILKQQFNRDAILRQLMLENNEFAGIRNMLEVYDIKIRDIWQDPYKTSQEKLAKIREFGTTRQVLQASYNSILADKFVSLFSRVIGMCSSTVEERVDEISTAVVSIHENKDNFIEQSIASGKSAQDRMYDQMVELQNILADTIKMFAFLQKEGTEEFIGRLNEKLPSTNEFINNLLSESRRLFIPENSMDLGNMIFDTINNGRIQLSMVEDKIKALMRTMFNALVEQNEVITYQQNVIDLLRANHVESLVVRDSLLKECFEVFTGISDVGLTSTVATYAGMRSRQANTLVVDITGHSHYDRYGIATENLDEFLLNRIQKPLLFVVGDINHDPETATTMIEELKTRLTYFRHLILVVDEGDTDILDQLGREALTISYITNCTSTSLQATEACYKVAGSLPNVGQKLICIDSPVDIATIATSMKFDITQTKVIPIPYLREMKKAAIVQQEPYTYTDVVRVFEEAFRV